VDWSPRMAVFGDLGSVNAKSLSYLQEETQEGKYDALLHVGEVFFFSNECAPQQLKGWNKKFSPRLLNSTSDFVALKISH